MTSSKTLHFHGPYHFLKGKTSLFHSGFSQNEGIYLWVIKDNVHDVNYIHYVGETSIFAKRHKDHLIHILGLNYYVIDADLARQGIHKIIWNGMWRDRSNDSAGITIESYESIGRHVVKHLECIDVYFAPTEFSKKIRKHIEGCIAWNLRNNYPELTKFYPADNRTVRNKEPLNEKLVISSDQPIAGLDTEIEI